MLIDSARPATKAVRVPTPETPWYRTRAGLLLGRVAVGVFLVLLWWLADALDVLPDTLLPSPLSVANAFVTLTTEPDFWFAMLQTVSNALIALALALVVGIPIGLVLGLLPKAERATRFLLDLGRSFPVIALLPVMILLLGVSSQMEILVIFLAVLWPVLLQTIYGSRRLDPVVRDTARVYRFTLPIRFLKVLLPAASPFIMTGIRVAGSLSILVAMAVELLAWTPGLGSDMGRALVDERPEIALGYFFWAGVLGIALNALLQFLEDKILVWNARADQGATNA